MLGCRRCLRRRGRLQRAGIGTDLANLGGRSLAAPHDRVPHCTAASSEAEPFRSSWRPVAAADAGSAGPDADPETCTKPGLNLDTWPEPLPAPSGVCTAGRKCVSLSQLCGGRTRAGSVRLPAALPNGGACGVAAVCRRPVKGPPRQFGERAFTGFPWVMRLGWSSVGLCGDIRGCVCPSARGAVGSKQSAASPAELAPQGALTAKTVAPTTVLTREIVPGTGQRRGLGAQEAQCGYPSPRCGPGDGKARYWHREFRGPISTAFHVLSQGKGVGN